MNILSSVLSIFPYREGSIACLPTRSGQWKVVDND